MLVKNLTNLNINFFIRHCHPTLEIGCLPFDGHIIICDHHVVVLLMIMIVWKTYYYYDYYGRPVPLTLAPCTFASAWMGGGWRMDGWALGLVIKCQMARWCGEELTHKPSGCNDKELIQAGWWRTWMMGECAYICSPPSLVASETRRRQGRR